MAENVQISLGIKSDSSQAKQDVSSLSRALRELQTIADGVGKGNSIMNYGKQIKAVSSEIAHFNGRNEIGKAIAAMNEQPNIANLTRFSNAVQSEYNRTADEIKQAAKEAGNANKSMTSSFGSLAKSLMRIAKLRLLRGIIRAITQAFREGVGNIYQYSQALGSVDASHFASTMDSLASSFLYLKNSIGAAVAPLISALVPALQTVVSWVSLALNYLAQFFAVINGQTTYTRAKQQATQWKAVEGAAGGAAAAAKEYENTILGFDELNVLNDPSKGGGGGGGGASAPDYSDMFEEVELPKNIFTSIAKLFSKDGVIGKAASFVKDSVDFAIQGIGPALSLLWGTLTGDIEMANQAWAELQKVISSNATAQKMMGMGMKVYKFFSQTIDDIKWMFLNSLEDILNFFSPVLELFGVDVDSLTRKIEDQKKEITRHRDETAGMVKWFQLWCSGMDETTARIVVNSQEIATTGAKSIANIAKGMNESKKSIDDTKKSTDYAKDAWGTYAQAVYNAQKTKYDGSNATGGLSNVSWWADNTYYKLLNVSEALAILGRTMVSASLSGLAISLNVARRERGGYVGGYADGGMIPSYAAGGVNSADLFMANENGNPELVGRIGSRTAVANQGQMVEALAQGLERIFSDGMNGSSNVEVVVNMDGVAVARAADRGNKSLNRRFNVQLA